MTIHLKHLFVNGHSDGVDPTKTQPSNWNAEHTLSSPAGTILGSDLTGPPNVQGLPQSFTAGGDVELTAAVGFFLGAQGTTAQRPAGVAGRRRYNIDSNKEEFWDTAVWQNVATEAWVTSQVASFGLMTTGDVKFTIKSAADVGWLLFQDQTIGSAASAATYHNDNCQALFLLLWNNVPDADAPVTGGRGLSAAADWASNKAMQLLFTTGRLLGVAGTGAGLTVRTLGQHLGAETHRLLPAESPVLETGIAGTGPSPPAASFQTVTPTPFNIMNPVNFLNAMIKL